MHETPASAQEGAVQLIHDLISPAPARALGATLNRNSDLRTGDTLPPLWHWLYFWSVAQQSDLGADGHPRTGVFLPELTLPRRMAAGGRLFFNEPLRIGDSATRTSRVMSIAQKEGSSGRLAFVTVEHVIEAGGAWLIREEQDIVYRGPATPGAPLPQAQPEASDAHWQREIMPSEPLLFRYSALTFNGHRIHYDRDYARQAEGYPDLVVHGPLIATLLLDLLDRSLPHAVVREYAFKAVRPTFLGHPFTVCGRMSSDGKSVALWSKDHEGWLTMSARATLG
jgi:3-methylfumaryl-CoA hydratase